MKRKLLSILLAVSMLAVMFTGCGKDEKVSSNDSSDITEQADPTDAPAKETATEAPEAAESEPITLKWTIWDKDLTPYWTDLQKAYQDANPNVTIEVTDLGSADYMTVLATELSGSGSDFDVVTIKDVPGYATLISKNTLEPLDNYISEAVLI
jgi:multiple sugar transport system substrate-binding protein